MRTLFLAVCLFASFTLRAADSLRVLFIGNSYTYVNDLPNTVSKLATASGDHLNYQVSAPGGYSLSQHAFYAPTLSLIAQGGWDYVVLQDQSQNPSFPDAYVAMAVYPFARMLDSLVHISSPCAKTVFYMTWGRKNGDADNCPAWPPVCTYTGMDSMLRLRYSIMAENNDAWLCPASKVWYRLRNIQPGLELYQADESHPSAAGTYATATAFYSLLFGKDPMLNSFNFTLSATDANLIKAAAKAVVFDSLAYWRQFDPPLMAAFTFTNAGSAVTFTSTSGGSILGYEWDFGDGSPHSYVANPAHTYSGSGPYTACLTVRDSCDTIRYCRQVLGATGIEEQAGLPGFTVAPNPFAKELVISGLQSKTLCTLYAISGSKVTSGSVTPQSPKLVLPDLPAGIYFLKLSTGKKEQMLKIVRE